MSQKLSEALAKAKSTWFINLHPASENLHLLSPARLLKVLTGESDIIAKYAHIFEEILDKYKYCVEYNVVNGKKEETGVGVITCYNRMHSRSTVTSYDYYNHNASYFFGGHLIIDLLESLQSGCVIHDGKVLKVKEEFGDAKEVKDAITAFLEERRVISHFKGSRFTLCESDERFVELKKKAKPPEKKTAAEKREDKLRKNLRDKSKSIYGDSINEHAKKDEDSSDEESESDGDSAFELDEEDDEQPPPPPRSSALGKRKIAPPPPQTSNADSAAAPLSRSAATLERARLFLAELQRIDEVIGECKVLSTYAKSTCEDTYDCFRVGFQCATSSAISTACREHIVCNLPPQ